jgi:hypothetical protein
VSAERCTPGSTPMSPTSAQTNGSAKSNSRLCSIVGHWPQKESRRYLQYNLRGVCAVCGAQIVKLQASGRWRTFDRVRWIDPRLSL